MRLSFSGQGASMPGDKRRPVGCTSIVVGGGFWLRQRAEMHSGVVAAACRNPGCSTQLREVSELRRFFVRGSSLCLLTDLFGQEAIKMSASQTYFA
jgi:hypothetical protein